MATDNGEKKTKKAAASTKKTTTPKTKKPTTKKTSSSTDKKVAVPKVKKTTSSKAASAPKVKKAEVVKKVKAPSTKKTVTKKTTSTPAKAATTPKAKKTVSRSKGAATKSNSPTVQNTNEPVKKIKRLKDPAKVKRRKNITFEAIFITLIVLVAVFTDKIPYLKDSKFASIIDDTLGKFFDIYTILQDNYLTILQTLTIIIFVWVLKKLSSLITKLFCRRKNKNTAKIVLLNSFINYFIIFFGIYLILSAWGIETTTILASFGLLGLAISFGAQGLIDDIISGLFLILEKQFEIGDIVYVDNFRGIVDQMGIRTTRFVDQYSLDVKIMRNSSVKNIINASMKLSVAKCDIGISYNADLKQIEEISKPFLTTLVDKYPDVIYGTPMYLGVQELGDSSVVLRFIGKTTEENKLHLERILKREIKLMFDENKITVPFPQIDVHNTK